MVYIERLIIGFNLSKELDNRIQPLIILIKNHHYIQQFSFQLLNNSSPEVEQFFQRNAIDGDDDGINGCELHRQRVELFLDTGDVTFTAVDELSGESDTGDAVNNCDILQLQIGKVEGVIEAGLAVGVLSLQFKEFVDGSAQHSQGGFDTDFDWNEGVAAADVFPGFAVIAHGNQIDIDAVKAG